MQNHDNDSRARLIEMDMANGTKLPYKDLDWYLGYKHDYFLGKTHWRHVESETVYRFTGLGLACTGNGKLVLMVHYKPEGLSGPEFERQYSLFRERFEPVMPRTVWDCAK